MPCLFASFRLTEWLWEVECLCEGAPPDDRGVIVGGTGPCGTVAAASPQVRREGVRQGMPMAVARAICPQARVLPGRVARLVDVISAVHTLVGGLLPETVWLDAAHGTAATTGRSPAELQGVLERIRHHVADTFALSLACGLASSRLAADVAARLVSPAGLVHFLPGYEARALAAVSLRCLDGIDAALLARCETFGCETIGDLAALAPERVDALAGGVGAVIAGLARGHDPRPVRVAAPPRCLSAYAAHPPGAGAAAGGESFAAAIAGTLADLLHHPQRLERRVTGIRVTGWSPGGTEDVRVLRPARRGVWDSASEVEAVLLDDLAASSPSHAQGCLSVQFEAATRPAGRSTVQPATTGRAIAQAGLPRSLDGSGRPRRRSA